MMCGNSDRGAIMDVVVWLRSLGLGKRSAAVAAGNLALKALTASAATKAHPRTSAIGKLLSGQLVVVAAIVIATPVSAACGAASDTCIRHGR
jgi:hypothetical protein